MAVVDTLTGSNIDAVVRAAIRGENHTIAAFERALENEELSDELRSIVERQHDMSIGARERIQALQVAAAS